MRATPVPISNTTVKTHSAEDTMLVTVWQNRWLPVFDGGVAQLGEHLPCKQGVRGSNPLISISYHENYISNKKTLKVEYSRDIILKP